MRKHPYLLIAISLSVVYWLFDSSIHWILFKEDFQFIPDEINELWMRTMLITILILFGLYVEHKTAELQTKEKEKQRIFHATLYSTQHILNNLLNQLLFVKIKLEQKGTLDEEIANKLDEMLHNSSEQVQALGKVKDISEETIKQSVYPRH